MIKEAFIKFFKKPKPIYFANSVENFFSTSISDTIKFTGAMTELTKVTKKWKGDFMKKEEKPTFEEWAGDCKRIGSKKNIDQIGGVKYDNDKLRFDLVPPNPLFELARVYTIGAKKYNDRNWEKGMAWCRIFGAMMRHAWKWFRGEKFDKDEGQHHLASVAWCAFALMEYENTHPELDDRPSKLKENNK